MSTVEQITISTDAYKTAHDKPPAQNKKGVYTFITPRKNRRWQFSGVTYKTACEQLENKAKQNMGAGVYTLLP